MDSKAKRKTQKFEFDFADSQKTCICYVYNAKHGYELKKINMNNGSNPFKREKNLFDHRRVHGTHINRLGYKVSTQKSL